MRFLSRPQEEAPFTGPTDGEEVDPAAVIAHAKELRTDAEDPRPYSVASMAVKAALGTPWHRAGFSDSGQWCNAGGFESFPDQEYQQLSAAVVGALQEQGQ